MLGERRTVRVPYHRREAGNELDWVLDIFLCHLHRRAVLLLQRQGVSASLGHPLVHLNTHRQTHITYDSVLSIVQICKCTSLVWLSSFTPCTAQHAYFTVLVRVFWNKAHCLDFCVSICYQPGSHLFWLILLCSDCRDLEVAWDRRSITVTNQPELIFVNVTSRLPTLIKLTISCIFVILSINLTKRPKTTTCCLPVALNVSALLEKKKNNKSTLIWQKGSVSSWNSWEMCFSASVRSE